MAETDDTITVDGSPPVQLPHGRFWRARWLRWPIYLAVAWTVLAVADVVVFHSSLVINQSRTSHVVATRAATHKHTHAIAPAPAAKKARPPAPRTRVLTPAGASAFGPAGPGSGDDAQSASMAIDASTATAWTTDWYRTAHFGGLQPGTGLLIDMGHPMTITSARIILGSARGADLQLRTGRAPALAKMRLQASMNDASGTVQLNLTRPHPARYLLIWFTQLPPDSAGTFKASVYDVRLKGYSRARPSRAGAR